MKTIALSILFAGLAVSAFGQATVMNDTNTLKVLKPSPSLFWASNRLDVLAALDLDLSINSGVPNGTGALVHWSQLTGVPAGFADGSDDGGGGGGSNFIASVSADFQVLAAALSLTNATGTGAFVRSSVLSGYQAADADLDDVADGSLSGAKVGPGISGDNVTTGTVADARIAATIARLASPALTGSPTVPDDPYDATAWNGSTGIPTKNAIRDKLESLGSGAAVGPATNTWSGLTINTDASGGASLFRVTLTNTTIATLAVPTGAADGARITWEIRQDSTGGRQVNLGTGWRTGGDIGELVVSTNANYVDYVVGIYNAADGVWRFVGNPRGYQ